MRPEATLAVVADGHDLSALYERVSAALTSVRGTIGIGGRCAARDLPRSFAEAARAMRIRTESRQPLGLSNHDDLGLLRILDTSDDGVRLERYVDEWLGPLIAHDRQHGSHLVHTLAGSNSVTYAEMSAKEMNDHIAWLEGLIARAEGRGRRAFRIT